MLFRSYGTSATFLEHFGLTSIKDLPGLEELKATGLLNREPPPNLMPIVGGQSDDPDQAPEDAEEESDGDDTDDGVSEGSEVIPLKPR